MKPAVAIAIVVRDIGGKSPPRSSFSGRPIVARPGPTLHSSSFTACGARSSVLVVTLGPQLLPSPRKRRGARSESLWLPESTLSHTRNCAACPCLATPRSKRRAPHRVPSSSFARATTLLLPGRSPCRTAVHSRRTARRRACASSTSAGRGGRAARFRSARRGRRSRSSGARARRRPRRRRRRPRRARSLRPGGRVERVRAARVAPRRGAGGRGFGGGDVRRRARVEHLRPTGAALAHLARRHRALRLSRRRHGGARRRAAAAAGRRRRRRAAGRRGGRARVGGRRPHLAAAADGGGGGAAARWRCGTWRPRAALLRFAPHGGAAVVALEFLEHGGDDAALLSAGRDGSLRLWRLPGAAAGASAADADDADAEAPLVAPAAGSRPCASVRARAPAASLCARAAARRRPPARLALCPRPPPTAGGSGGGGGATGGVRSSSPGTSPTGRRLEEVPGVRSASGGAASPAVAAGRAGCSFGCSAHAAATETASAAAAACSQRAGRRRWRRDASVAWRGGAPPAAAAPKRSRLLRPLRTPVALPPPPPPPSAKDGAVLGGGPRRRRRRVVARGRADGGRRIWRRGLWLGRRRRRLR